MKKNKRSLVAVIVCLLLSVVIFSLTACEKTTPKLDSKNLEGWSVRFNDVWLNTGTGMAEFNLADYTDKPMEIAFIGDSIHYLSANLYYNGKVQDDYIFTWNYVAQYYDTNEGRWINLNQMGQPIQKAGDYRFGCSIVARDGVKMGSGGVDYGVSHRFDLNVEVVYR